MVNLKKLRENKKSEIVTFDELPREISMTKFARDKAYALNEIVNKKFHISYEWYGFTIAEKENPELILDIGIGKNHENSIAYTKIDSEKIDDFESNLDFNLVINGWIHSHGDLGFKHFSGTDDNNQKTVLNYVTSLLKKPLRKKEIKVEKLEKLLEGNYSASDLKKGTLTAITDKPIEEIKLMGLIKGGFSYAIVIGDEGWHEQEIYHREFDMLTGKDKINCLKPDNINLVDYEKTFTESDRISLEKEVDEKIKPYMPYYKRKLFRFKNKKLKKMNNNIFSKYNSARDENTEDLESSVEKIEHNKYE